MAQIAQDCRWAKVTCRLGLSPFRPQPRILWNPEARGKTGTPYVRLAFDGRQDNCLQVRPDTEETHQPRDGAHHAFGGHFAAL